VACLSASRIRWSATHARFRTPQDRNRQIIAERFPAGLTRALLRTMAAPATASA